MNQNYIMLCFIAAIFDLIITIEQLRLLTYAIHKKSADDSLLNVKFNSL